METLKVDKLSKMSFELHKFRETGLKDNIKSKITEN